MLYAVYYHSDSGHNCIALFENENNAIKWFHFVKRNNVFPQNKTESKLIELENHHIPSKINNEKLVYVDVKND